MGTVCVQDAALLQHLSSEEHRANVVRFWKKNKLNPEEKKQSRFTLPAERLVSFKQRAVVAVRSYEQIKKQKLQEETMQYKQQSTRQQSVVTMAAYMQEHKDQIEPWQANSRKSREKATQDGEKLKGFRTIAAQGEGLTCIHITSRDDRLGNVHGGAAPPWLSSEPVGSIVSQNTVIGPTQDTFKQYLETERKRKLPANRVGAKRDKNENIGSDWLPMFGHVWSSAARTQQRKLKGTHKPSSTWVPQSNPSLYQHSATHDTYTHESATNQHFARNTTKAGFDSFERSSGTNTSQNMQTQEQHFISQCSSVNAVATLSEHAIPDGSALYHRNTDDAMPRATGGVHNVSKAHAVAYIRKPKSRAEGPSTITIASNLL